MKSRQQQASGENLHDEVYGATFARYTKIEIEEFIEPLKIRFERNDINPRDVFLNQHCLDAGCGSGRGAIFMLLNGATSVTGVDFSPLNVETTRRNASLFGFDNVDIRQGTLADLPFEDEKFDVLWCNGVIHHTEKPDTCLKEVTRVLKKDGQAWIYLYGAGGVYWYAVRRIRALMHNLDSRTIQNALTLMRYETPYIAEYIDDWKVSYLRTYTPSEVETRFRELGYTHTELLSQGVDYDTSHRVNNYPEDATWLGNGDLRYLLTKKEEQTVGNYPLSETEYGSDASFDPRLEARFGPLFDTLEEAVSGNWLMAVAASAYIQNTLREIMSETGPFRVEFFAETIEKATEYALE